MDKLVFEEIVGGELGIFWRIESQATNPNPKFLIKKNVYCIELSSKIEHILFTLT